MENKQQMIFLLAVASFCSVAFYFFWPTLNQEFVKKEVILVKIKLENRCSFNEDVFIVLHKDTGRSVHFNNGVANINVMEGSDLVLALSPLYPDFRYDGVPQPAKPQMNMIADCSASPRMQMIMESMKESFKN
tara:strand:+ start:103 stop:501 length:399 start_codon:yes stop_codon:yes gene_type:complete